MTEHLDVRRDTSKLANYIIVEVPYLDMTESEYDKWTSHLWEAYQYWKEIGVCTRVRLTHFKKGMPNYERIELQCAPFINAA